MKKVFNFNFRGREIVVEHGEMAMQAHGAVLVRYGDTVILSTAVVAPTANLLSDFFPLMVLYNEKLYSVGKIPGGFIKREGRPTDAATLAARMIDRPLRPLFPEDFRNEVQIVNTVLSVDQDNSPELTALFGSSLSVSISKAPFNGPVAAVKVGRVNGEFVINPTVEQTEVSDLDLTVAGTREAINMVEAGAMEVSEEDMLEALMFGHEAIKELISFEEANDYLLDSFLEETKAIFTDEKVYGFMEQAFGDRDRIGIKDIPLINFDAFICLILAVIKKDDDSCFYYVNEVDDRRIHTYGYVVPNFEFIKKD